MNSDARVLRGMSIAAIVMSILGAIVALIVVVCGMVGVFFANDPQFIDAMYYEMSSNASYDPYSQAMLVSFITSSFMWVVVVIGLFGVALKGAAIAAGLFGLKAASDPSKREAAFIWAVIAAVLNGITGSLVSMALFIVSAVYINRIRANESRSAWGQAAGFAAQPQEPPYQPAPQVPYQQNFAQQAPYQQRPVQQVPHQQQAPVQPAPYQGQMPAQPAPFGGSMPIQQAPYPQDASQGAQRPAASNHSSKAGMAACESSEAPGASGAAGESGELSEAGEPARVNGDSVGSSEAASAAGSSEAAAAAGANDGSRASSTAAANDGSFASEKADASARDGKEAR